MLTLQSLRDKGGVLLAVLIGVALLAFILGDMLSSGSVLFGSRNKVGKIEGNSINYQDYAIKLDYYTNVYDLISGSSQDANERAAEQAWESLVREGVFTPQFKKLGLNVSDKESQEMISVENPSPVIAQLFSDRSTGFYSPEAYRSFLETASYDATGQRMKLLSYLKSEADYISETAKAAAVFTGGYFPTQNDVTFNAKVNSKSRNIRFIYKKMRDVSDSLISYSDSDVKKYYEEHKNAFRAEDMRTVNYVTFDVTPSQNDFIEAQKIVDKMAAEFATSANPKLYADANSTDKNLSHYYKRDQLDAALAEYAFSGKDEVYGPYLEDRLYTMAKSIKVRNLVDSIELRAIVVENEKLADSLMEVIAAGGNFADLAMQYSVEPNSAQNGGNIGTYDPATLPDEILDKVIDAKAGQTLKLCLNNLYQVINVVRTEGNQPRVLLAISTYKVEPSKETRNMVFNRASKFATSAAGGLRKFMQVKSDSMLEVRVANVQPADNGVEGIENSREIVTWAFAKGDEEGTSGVMEFGDMFLVAALASTDVRGYKPLDRVREDIVYALKSELKASYLRKEMAGGSSLDEVAQKLGLQIQEAQDVTFNTYSFPEVGFNSGFAGGLTYVKPGTLSNPIVTVDAVFLAEVVSENALETENIDQVRETIKAENDQYSFQQAYVEAIVKAEITDQRYKLYR